MEKEELQEALDRIVIDGQWIVTLHKTSARFLFDLMEMFNLDPWVIIMALALTMQEVLNYWEEEAKGDGSASDA